MTLVVTYAESFLACFTRNPDGTMRQRALIDIGDRAPTAKELAETGEILANQYGWNGVEVSSPPVKAKAVAGKPRRKALPRKRGYNSSDPPVPERKRMIVEYLSGHSLSSLRGIIVGCGFEYDIPRNGRWTFQIRALVAEGVVVMSKGSDSFGAVNLYSLAPLSSGVE